MGHNVMMTCHVIKNPAKKSKSSPVSKSYENFCKKLYYLVYI